MQAVLQETKDRGLVERCDETVVTILGERMVKKVKELHPEYKSLSPINGVIEALKFTHWFQEDVRVFNKNETSAEIGLTECSWQKYWKRKQGEYYPECIKPHLGFLRTFCYGWDNNLEVVNLISPDSQGQCKWKIAYSPVKNVNEEE